MTLKEYFDDWYHIIDTKELSIVLKKLEEEYRRKPICPLKNEVFKAFKLCKYKDLKVVMLSQDPYPQKGVATGILFGNKKEVEDKDLSPSLQIIKEASIDYEVPHNNIIFDPTLESWAKQGILMLNSALTVEMNIIGSHTMLWRPFISSFLKNLGKAESGLVYVLFGKQAQTFKPYINQKNNIILEENHPSYYARMNTRMPSSIFKQINKILVYKYGIPIEWYKEI